MGLGGTRQLSETWAAVGRAWEGSAAWRTGTCAGHPRAPAELAREKASMLLEGLAHSFRAVQTRCSWRRRLSSLLSRSAQAPGGSGTERAWQPESVGPGLCAVGAARGCRDQDRLAWAGPHLPTVPTLAILAPPVYPMVPHEGWLAEERSETAVSEGWKPGDALESLPRGPLRRPRALTTLGAYLTDVPGARFTEGWLTAEIYLWNTQ